MLEGGPIASIDRCEVDGPLSLAATGSGGQRFCSDVCSDGLGALSPGRRKLCTINPCLLVRPIPKFEKTGTLSCFSFPCTSPSLAGAAKSHLHLRFTTTHPDSSTFGPSKFAKLAPPPCPLSRPTCMFSHARQLFGGQTRRARVKQFSVLLPRILFPAARKSLKSIKQLRAGGSRFSRNSPTAVLPCRPRLAASEP